MGNPRIDPTLKHIQRQRSATQDLVVKCTNIESIAKRFPCALAQLDDLQLPQLIGQLLKTLPIRHPGEGRDPVPCAPMW